MVKGSKPFGPIIILTKLFILTKSSNSNEIHQTGSTVVLITHDIHLVKHAERTIFLKDGIIEKIKKNGKNGKRGK